MIISKYKDDLAWEKTCHILTVGHAHLFDITDICAFDLVNTVLVDNRVKFV